MFAAFASAFMLKVRDDSPPFCQLLFGHVLSDFHTLAAAPRVLKVHHLGPRNRDLSNH